MKECKTLYLFAGEEPSNKDATILTSVRHFTKCLPEILDVCYFLGQIEVRGVTKEYDFTRLKGSMTIKIELLVLVLNDQEANKQTNRLKKNNNKTKQIPKQKQNATKTNKQTNKQTMQTSRVADFLILNEITNAE